jgi:hypothetical protein
LYGYDPVKDAIPELMHLSANQLKDLLRSLADALQMKGVKPIVKDVTPKLLNFIKQSMYPNLRHNRRFVRNITHAAISQMTAEEVLIFIRVSWRPFMEGINLQFKNAKCPMHPVMYEVMKAFELLEGILLKVLDRRGLQCSISELDDVALAYIEHLQTASTEWFGRKRAIFSGAYVTLCVHSLLHYGQCIATWGNLFESWSFEFERVAGELTDIVKDYNGKSFLGNQDI